MRFEYIPSKTPWTKTDLDSTLESTAYYPQRFLPTQKSTSGQELLQNALIRACELGDEKSVSHWLSKGAKPDIANADKKCPLGAAIWSMNPNVVKQLLKELNNVSPMTWKECEDHNMLHYKELFTINNFLPKTFGAWEILLKKIDSNDFIKSYHLQEAAKEWEDDCTSSWKIFQKWVCDNALSEDKMLAYAWDPIKCGRVFHNTTMGYEAYQTQIKKEIDSAPRPKIGITLGAT